MDVEIILYVDLNSRIGWHALVAGTIKDIMYRSGYHTIGNARRAYKAVARKRGWTVKRELKAVDE